MAQLENPGSEVKMQLGCCHLINFGKYKGLTIYDIANEKDFKYLRWLLSVNKLNSKYSFEISESVFPHAKIALQSIQDEGKWEKHVVGSNPEKIFYENGEGRKSPEIYVCDCCSCNSKIFKNKNTYKENEKLICWKCQKLNI